MFNIDLSVENTGMLVSRNITNSQDLSVEMALANLLNSSCETQPEETVAADDYATIDLLEYVIDGIPTLLIDSIAYNKTRYTYMLEKDGRYNYHKFVLHVASENRLPKYEKSYFYYKNNVYFCKQKLTKIEDILNPEYATVLERANYSELIKHVGRNYRYDKELFTIVNLNKCVAKLQKKAVLANIENCGKLNCGKGDSIKSQRDFLFLSAYVLDYLINSGKFDEAEEILNSLSSCQSLCSESTINCNCNG